MFEDPARFSFAAELERKWETIRDEMIALRSSGFIAWPEKSLYGETGWSTFGLYAFGQKQARSGAFQHLEIIQGGNDLAAGEKLFQVAALQERRVGEKLIPETGDWFQRNPCNLVNVVHVLPL